MRPLANRKSADRRGRELSFARLPLAFGFWAVLRLLASCQGGGEARNRSSDPAYLEGGTLSFHDPAPRPGKLRASPAKPQPITLTITTVGDEERDTAEESKEMVLAGRVGKDKEARSLSEREVPAAVLQQARKLHATVISSSRFAKLWDSLVDAGILNLTRHSGSKPPAGRAYIQVDAEGQRWLFLRPEDTSLKDKPAAEQARIRAWWACQLIIVQAANG